MEKLLDRIVTVIFVIALIAIIYFVAQYVSQRMLYGETNDIEIETEDDDFILDSEDVDDTYDNDNQEYYDEDGLVGKDVPEEYNDEIASIMEDVTGETEEVDNSSETVTRIEESTPIKEEEASSATSTTTSSVTENKARYMIVAGSFTSKPNAEVQVGILEKQGYEPEIVNFNSSRMFTVVAARYNNRESANAAAKQLKGNKIECYVHTKRLK